MVVRLYRSGQRHVIILVKDVDAGPPSKQAALFIGELIQHLEELPAVHHALERDLQTQRVFLVEALADCADVLALLGVGLGGCGGPRLFLRPVIGGGDTHGKVERPVAAHASFADRAHVVGILGAAIHGGTPRNHGAGLGIISFSYGQRIAPIKVPAHDVGGASNAAFQCSIARHKAMRANIGNRRRDNVDNIVVVIAYATAKIIVIKAPNFRLHIRIGDDCVDAMAHVIFQAFRSRLDMRTIIILAKNDDAIALTIVPASVAPLGIRLVEFRRDFAAPEIDDHGETVAIVDHAKRGITVDFRRFTDDIKVDHADCDGFENHCLAFFAITLDGFARADHALADALNGHRRETLFQGALIQLFQLFGDGGKGGRGNGKHHDFNLPFGRLERRAVRRMAQRHAHSFSHNEAKESNDFEEK